MGDKPSETTVKPSGRKYLSRGDVWQQLVILSALLGIVYWAVSTPSPIVHWAIGAPAILAAVLALVLSASSWLGVWQYAHMSPAQRLPKTTEYKPDSFDSLPGHERYTIVALPGAVGSARLTLAHDTASGHEAGRIGLHSMFAWVQDWYRIITVEHPWHGILDPDALLLHLLGRCEDGETIVLLGLGSGANVAEDLFLSQHQAEAGRRRITIKCAVISQPVFLRRPWHWIASILQCYPGGPLFNCTLHLIAPVLMHRRSTRAIVSEMTSHDIKHARAALLESVRTSYGMLATMRAIIQRAYFGRALYERGWIWTRHIEPIRDRVVNVTDSMTWSWQAYPGSSCKIIRGARRHCAPHGADAMLYQTELLDALRELGLPVPR